MSRLEGSISQGAQASCSESASPLFTSCLEEVFSETELPVYGILGNSGGIKRAGAVRPRPLRLDLALPHPYFLAGLPVGLPAGLPLGAPPEAEAAWLVCW